MTKKQLETGARIVSFRVDGETGTPTGRLVARDRQGRRGGNAAVLWKAKDIALKVQEVDHLGLAPVMSERVPSRVRE